mgnify:CR=1 FL=1
MPDDTDTVVLELLAQAGIAVSPGAIAANVAHFTERDLSAADVATALETLDAENYVRTLADTDYYRLTDHGRNYAEQEFVENAPGYID